MMRGSMIAVAFAFCCSASTAQDANFVKACEAAISKRLISPSAYKRISLKFSTEKIPIDEHLKRSKEDQTIKDFIRKMNPHATRYLAIVEYDAAVRSGAFSRNTSRCSYETIGGPEGASELTVQIDGKTANDRLIDAITR